MPKKPYTEAELKAKIAKKKQTLKRRKGKTIGESIGAGITGTAGLGGAGVVGGTAIGSAAAIGGEVALGSAAAGVGAALVLPVALVGIAGALIGTSVARKKKIEKTRRKIHKLEKKLKKTQSDNKEIEDNKKLLRIQERIHKKAGDKKVVKPSTQPTRKPLGRNGRGRKPKDYEKKVGK